MSSSGLDHSARRRRIGRRTPGSSSGEHPVDQVFATGSPHDGPAGSFSAFTAPRSLGSAPFTPTSSSSNPMPNCNKYKSSPMVTTHKQLFHHREEVMPSDGFTSNPSYFDTLTPPPPSHVPPYGNQHEDRFRLASRSNSFPGKVEEGKPHSYDDAHPTGINGSSSFGRSSPQQDGFYSPIDGTRKRSPVSGPTCRNGQFLTTRDDCSTSSSCTECSTSSDDYPRLSNPVEASVNAISCSDLSCSANGRLAQRFSTSCVMSSSSTSSSSSCSPSPSPAPSVTMSALRHSESALSSSGRGSARKSARRNMHTIFVGTGLLWLLGTIAIPALLHASAPSVETKGEDLVRSYMAGNLTTSQTRGKWHPPRVASLVSEEEAKRVVGGMVSLRRQRRALPEDRHWSILNRKVAAPLDVPSKQGRMMELYPAEFSDRTQLYSVLDSSDEALSKMERVQVYAPDCVPMQEWQTTFYPTCNELHMVDLGNAEERQVLFGKKGFWRDAWRVDGQDETTVLKTLKYGHMFEEDFYEHNRVDAVAMERLTSSPHVMNIYSFCGQSALTEFADVARFGAPADKAKGLAKLKLAKDLASGLADLHSIDGEGNATFAHFDVNLANVVVSNGTVKLNDFNIGILMRWNETSKTRCGFPAKYPNPQWRSPEEARESQELTEKVDVFSMGHVFFRLICGHEPWNKLEPNGKPSKTEMNDKVKAGKLPFIPAKVMNSTDYATVAIREAMLACYTVDPQKRPTSRQVFNDLDEALRLGEMSENLSKGLSAKRLSPALQKLLRPAQVKSSGHAVKVSNATATSKQKAPTTSQVAKHAHSKDHHKVVPKKKKKSTVKEEHKESAAKEHKKKYTSHKRR